MSSPSIVFDGTTADPNSSSKRDVSANVTEFLPAKSLNIEYTSDASVRDSGMAFLNESRRSLMLAKT